MKILLISMYICKLEDMEDMETGKHVPDQGFPNFFGLRHPRGSFFVAKWPCRSPPFNRAISGLNFRLVFAICGRFLFFNLVYDIVSVRMVNNKKKILGCGI